MEMIWKEIWNSQPHTAQLEVWKKRNGTFSTLKINLYVEENLLSLAPWDGQTKQQYGN